MMKRVILTLVAVLLTVCTYAANGGGNVGVYINLNGTMNLYKVNGENWSDAEDLSSCPLLNGVDLGTPSTLIFDYAKAISWSDAGDKFPDLNNRYKVFYRLGKNGSYTAWQGFTLSSPVFISGNNCWLYTAENAVKRDLIIEALQFDGEGIYTLEMGVAWSMENNVSSLSEPTQATQTATFTAANPVVTLSIDSSSIIEGNSTDVHATVSSAIAVTPLVITLSISGNPEYFTGEKTITIAVGQTSGSTTLTARDDHAKAGNKVATIGMISAEGLAGITFTHAEDINLTIMDKDADCVNPDEPEATAESVCKDISTEATITVTNHTIYDNPVYSLWDAPAEGNQVGSNETTGTITVSATFDAAKTYYLQVAESGVSAGCDVSDRSMVIVGIKEKPSDFIYSTTKATSETADGTITFTAGSKGLKPFTVNLTSAGESISQVGYISGSNNDTTFTALPAANDYQAVITGADGCGGVTITNIEIQENACTPPANPAIDGGAKSICKGTPTIINITNFESGITYNLLNINGDIIASNSGNDNVINVPGTLAAGTYRLQGTGYSGGTCTESNTVNALTVKVRPNEATATVIQQSSPTVNLGKISVTTGSAGGSPFTLNLTNGSDVTLNATGVTGSHTFEQLPAGSYILTITSNNACDSVINGLTVTECTPPATPTLQQEEFAICGTGRVFPVITNADTNELTYSLYNEANNAQIAGYSLKFTGTEITINNMPIISATTNYTIRATRKAAALDGCRMSTKQITVVSNAIPVISTNVNNAGAENNDGSIEVMVVEGAQVFLNDINEQTAPYTYEDLTAGTYEIKAVNAVTGCKDSVNVTVILDIPVFNVSPLWQVHGDSLVIMFYTNSSEIITEDFKMYDNDDVYVWGGVVFKDENTKYVNAGVWKDIPEDKYKMTRIAPYTYRWVIKDMAVLYKLTGDVEGILSDVKGYQWLFRTAGDGNGNNIFEEKKGGSAHDGNFYENIHSFAVRVWAVPEGRTEIDGHLQFYQGEKTRLYVEKFIDGVEQEHLHDGKRHHVSIKLGDVCVLELDKDVVYNDETAGKLDTIVTLSIPAKDALRAYAYSEGGAMVHSENEGEHYLEVIAATAELSQSASTVNETTASTDTVRVTVPAAYSDNIQIPVTVTGGVKGTDFTLSYDTINIEAGQTSGYITIEIIPDGLYTDRNSLEISVPASVTSGDVTFDISGSPLALAVENSEVAPSPVITAFTPLNGQNLMINEVVTISATATNADTMYLFINGNQVARNEGSSISYNYTPEAVKQDTFLIIARNRYNQEANVKHIVHITNCDPNPAPGIAAIGAVYYMDVSVDFSITNYSAANTYTLWTSEENGEEVTMGGADDVKTITMLFTKDTTFYLEAFDGSREGECQYSARTPVTITVNPAPVITLSQSTNSVSERAGSNTDTIFASTNATFNKDIKVAINVTGGSHYTLSYDTITILTDNIRAYVILSVQPDGADQPRDPLTINGEIFGWDLTLVGGPLTLEVINDEGGVGYEVSVSNESRLGIYPNPVLNGIITIESGMPAGTVYSIVNLQGLTLIEGKTLGAKTKINISSLPGGMYFLKVSSDVIKFVVR